MIKILLLILWLISFILFIIYFTKLIIELKRSKDYIEKKENIIEDIILEKMSFFENIYNKFPSEILISPIQYIYLRKKILYGLDKDNKYQLKLFNMNVIIDKNINSNEEIIVR